MSSLVPDEAAYELMEYGLSFNQAKIYLTLLRLGRGKASEVSRVSKISRTEVYRITDKLRKIGIIEASLEKPIVFQPVPPSKLLKILVNGMNEKMANLREKQDKVISDLKSIKGRVEREERIYFCTVVGGRMALERAIEICQKAKEEILYIVSWRGLCQAAVYGLLEAFKKRVDAGVRVRVISEVQESNLKEAKLFLNICELRHADKLTAHILMVDCMEVLVGVSIKEDLPFNAEDRIDLWTNNPGFVGTMERFSQELWNNAIGGETRIQSIETAKPVEEFRIIRGRDETLRKIIEMTNSAKSEIDHMTTTNGLYRIYQAHYEQYETQSEKGIKIRILAPVTKNNEEVAKKLAKVASLRNIIPFSVIRLCLVDDREMMLYEPFPDDPTIDAGHFVAFWNNSKSFIELMKPIFESMWSNASDVRFTA